MRSLLQAFRKDIRASTGPVVGLMSLAVFGTAALSVDSSIFYVKKRQLQSAVDLAAIAAAASASNSSAARSAASASLSANTVTPTTLDVTTGSFDSTRALGSRFVGNASPSNAAAVRATISTPMILGRLLSLGSGATSVSLSATGHAAALPLAAFGIGSRLASLDGGVANAVLSGLTGSRVSLTAADYQSLASANIDMAKYANALAAAVGAKSGTYADLLGRTVSLSTALSAIASSGVDTQTAAALASIVNALPTSTAGVSLGSIVDFGTGDSLTIGSKLPAQVTMPAFDLVSGLAQMAAGTQPMTIDLSAAAPGLSGASLTLTLGAAKPTTVIAPPAMTTTASTRQIQMALTTSTTVPGLGTVRLPLSLSVAKSVATTQGATCSQGAPQVQLAVTPGVADVKIGGGSAPIATILGIGIDASGRAGMGATSATTQTFAASDVKGGTVKSTSSTSLTSSLVGSALGNLSYSLYGLNLPVALPTTTATALGSALNGLATPTDALVDSVARTLGIGVGEADTWVTDLRCGSPVLVL